jgi:predicted nucleic acid-binding protein
MPRPGPTSTSEAPALVDTNVLGYAFDIDEPEKRRICAALLARCWRGEARYSVSVQNLAELSVLLTEKIEHPVPHEMTGRIIRNIVEFEGWNVLRYSGQEVLGALEIQKKYGLHFWDSLLVATMDANRITSIITGDRQFSRIPHIRVVDPFG